MRSAWLLLLLFASGCGNLGEAAPARLSAPLLGGAPTSPAEYPATGALVVALGNGPPQYLCSATLVAPTLVVTAAHCFIGLGARLPDFVLADDLASAGSARRVHGRALQRHPEFVVQPGAGQPAHDVAALLLGDAVETLLFPPLARATDAAQIATLPSLSLVSFGPLTRDGAAGRKNAARLSVEAVSDSELVVGASDGTSACVGDSGGAAFAELPGGRVLAGVVSRADDANLPCAGATRLTRIDAHEGWLSDLIAAESLRAAWTQGAPSSPGCSIGGPRLRGATVALPLMAIIWRLRRRRRPGRAGAAPCTH